MGINRALLLCNWSYDDPGGTYQPLRGPASNLDTIRRALTHPEYGVFDDDHISVASDLKADQISEAIYSFVQAADPDDTVLIYYSGHGERLVNQQLGLCGINVTAETKDVRAFDTRMLRTWLEDLCRAQARIVVLDCCYAGNYLGAAPSVEDIRQSFGDGVAVLTSGGNVPVRDAEHADTPTPFTEALGQRPGLRGHPTQPRGGNPRTRVRGAAALRARASSPSPTAPDRSRFTAAGTTPSAGRRPPSWACGAGPRGSSRPSTSGSARGR